MPHRLTTLEQTSDGDRLTVERGTSLTLAHLVRRAHDRGWLPGAVSGTGLVIVETMFEGTDGQVERQTFSPRAGCTRWSVCKETGRCTSASICP